MLALLWSFLALFQPSSALSDPANSSAFPAVRLLTQRLRDSATHRRDLGAHDPINLLSSLAHQITSPCPQNPTRPLPKMHEKTRIWSLINPGRVRIVFINCPNHPMLFSVYKPAMLRPILLSGYERLLSLLTGLWGWQKLEIKCVIIFRLRWRTSFGFSVYPFMCC